MVCDSGGWLLAVDWRGKVDATDVTTPDVVAGPREGSSWLGGSGASFVVIIVTSSRAERCTSDMCGGHFAIPSLE